MSLRSQLGALRRDFLCARHRREVRFENHGPIVSFTFDDFPRSAWTTGGAILERFDARGTYYTAMGLMDSEGEEGTRFSENDLHEILENGHELASHTFKHSSACALQAQSFRQEVDRGREAAERFSDAASANFAYPYGEVTLAAKKAVAASVTSARGNFPGINVGKLDLNLLFGNALYGDISKLAATKKLVGESIERAGWLIFYTHDVQPQPSRYGCTPDLLEAVVSFAAERGCHILSIQQTLESIGVPKGQPTARAARSVPA